MAEKLNGVQQVTTSVSDLNGVVLLSNESGERMHIREVHLSSVWAHNDTNVGYAHIQIGRNNSLITTDQDKGVKMQAVVGPPDQSTTSQGLINKSWYFAKGQYPLDNFETLYQNLDVTGVFDAQNTIVDVYFHD